MLVAVSMASTGGKTVSTVTYGSQSLTLVGAKKHGNDRVRVEIWSLVNPTSGTANVTVTLTSASNGFVVGAVTFIGVDQTTPLGAFASDFGTSTAPGVNVSSAVDDVAFAAVVFKNGATLNAGANQAQIWTSVDGATAVRGAACTEPGAATVAMTWSQPGGSADDWVVGGVSIKPAPAADVSTTVTGPTSVIAGANLTYTVAVTNLGPYPTFNVVVTNTLPVGATFVSGSNGATNNNGNVTWTASVLAANAKTNFTVTVTAPTLAGGTLTNIVSSGAGLLDTNPSNNDGSAASARVITTVTIGPMAKLQILMPGETAAPGTASGKTGSPSAQTVGVPFNFTVNAVDANWNLVSSTDSVAITSSDSLAALPANAAMVAGSKNFTVTFFSAGSRTLTASDVTVPAITAGTSAATTVAKGNQTITFAALANTTPTNTVALSATASSGLTVSFAVTSGPGSIANGTNLTFSGAGTVSITASQAGNANWTAAADVVRTLSVNSLPIPASPTIQRWTLGDVKVRAANLLGVDPDGDVLTLVSAGPETAQGGSITMNETWVFYTRPSGFTNADSFTYVVSDTRGGSSQGSVTIAITTDIAATSNYTVDDLGGGSAQIRFSGIPGRNYAIYFSETSGPIAWTALTNKTATTAGEFVCLDNPTNGANSRLYRAVEVAP